jgi:dTDP-4-dehydrorhamnose reductase
MNHKASKLILHLGLAKTGTSAIQETLHTNRQNLLDRHSILYPGKDGSHFHLQSLFSPRPETLREIQILGLSNKAEVAEFVAQYRSDFLAEIEACQPDVIVISSEYFVSMSVVELSAMREFLMTVAERIFAFCYVRDPWEFSVSMLQEMIRSGEVDRDVEFGYMESNVSIIAKFESAFPGQLTVASYSRKTGPANVVRDFMNRFQLPFDECAQNAKLDTNRSMGREAATVMTYLNSLYPTFNKDGEYIRDGARDWMMEALESAATTPLRISQRTAELIYECSRDDVAFLENRYFGGEPTFSNGYLNAKFDDFDDALSISSMEQRHLAKYMLSCMRFLAERALDYHSHMERNSTERIYWHDKYHELVRSRAAEESDCAMRTACVEQASMVKPATSRIVVVGARGLIGRCLLEAAKRAGTAMGTSSTAIDGYACLRLDAPNEFDYSLIETSDTVFFTAAISSPDLCARDAARAHQVNVIGTKSVISSLLKKSVRVVFFSSDAVYGTKYTESDESATCSPSSAYAKMKYEVECEFRGNPLFKAIRLSYVFAADDKFTQYLARCEAIKEDADVFHPFFRAVIARQDVVAGALALAARWSDFPNAVINFGGPVAISRIEFAKQLQASVLPALTFHVSEPAPTFFLERPRMIRIISPILSELLGRAPLTVAEAARIELDVLIDELAERGK